MHRIVAFFALALLAAPGVAQDPIALHCARGTPDYPDARLTLSNSGNHVVDVVFVGYRPSRPRADWSLRDCLATAARLDASRDIVATLWYRNPEAQYRQEPLQPYGAVYQASSRKVLLARPAASEKR